MPHKKNRDVTMIKGSKNRLFVGSFSLPVIFFSAIVSTGIVAISKH